MSLSIKERRALGAVQNNPGHWTLIAMPSLTTLEKKGIVRFVDGKAYLAEGAAEHLPR